MQINPKLEIIRFDGGTLVLDFINTVHDRTEATLRDYLLAPQDCLYWARKKSLVSPVEYRKLQSLLEANRNGSDEWFSNVLMLRECLYQIFSAVAQKKRVQSGDLQFFNGYLSRYFSHLKISFDRDRFTEGWDFDAPALEHIFAPIIKDGRRLMLEESMDKIKECPNCGWLFIDTSKNGRRRWCSMDTCGSMVKSLDYYYRKKAQGEREA
jgi:predicted RNA-binding Zn ribbon-like protein